LPIQRVLARNCLAAYKAKEKRDPDFDRRALIGLMTEHLGDGYNRDRVRAALADYFPVKRSVAPKRLWRIDYLEAFAGAVEVPVHELCHDGFGGESNVVDGSPESFLAQMVGKRLTPDQIQTLVQDIRDIGRRPGSMELLSAIARAVLESSMLLEAQGKIIELLMESGLWDQITGRAVKTGGKQAPRRRSASRGRR
jgi:hypothetical protein